MRMKRKLWASIGLVALLLGLVPAAPVSAGGNVSPRAMLEQYFEAINRGAYQVAYAQWINPPQTYRDFVSGYSDTISINARFGGFRPVNAADSLGRLPETLIGSVPAVLVANRGGDPTDGPIYYGCYVLAYDPKVTGMAQWRILSGSLKLGSGIPNTNTIQGWLNRADCYGYDQLAPDQFPALALSYYYDQVNSHFYRAAYDMWSTPYQTFDDFEAGYADTTDVVLFTGRVCPRERYVMQARTGVRVVLMGYHTDGSLAAYGGSIDLLYDATKPRHWGIVSADLALLDTSTRPLTQEAIFQALGAACA